MRTISYLFPTLAGILLLTTATNAQNVGINSTGVAGHPSAMLDVSSANKGVLFPNVPLTAANDAGTISSPAKGLMVWNTGATWGTAGFYYNDGSSGAPNWLKVATGSTAISNTLGSSGNTLTSTVNGVVATASAVNTVSNTSSTNTLSTTVNGVVGTGVNIINNNSLSWTKAGNLGSSVNGVSSTVTVGSGTVADVLGYNASGAPVYESLSSVVKEPWYQENSTTPANSNSQNIYQNAKVGIGNFTAGQTFNTGSPVATLEVTGAGSSLRVGPRYDSGGDRDYVDILADGTASKISTTNEGFVIENAGNGYLSFETNDAEQARIDAAGNMGIGVVPSSYKLSVNGTIEAVDFGAAGSQNLRIGDDAYLTDVDIANTLGIYSSSTAGEGRLALGATTEMILRSPDQTANFGQANTFDFDDATNEAGAPGIVVESAGGSSGESGGFFANGNTTAIWSPGDGTGGILSIYDEDAMSLTAPMIRVESDGDLKMYSDNSIHMPNNVGHITNRTEQSFAATNTTFVNIAGTTSSVQVDVGDVVVVNATFKFKFVGGSGGDDVKFRLNVTGCSATTQAETYEHENFDNDRNEYQVVSMQYVHVSTCTGSLQFSIQMDAFSDADDDARVGDLVIVAQKY